MPGAVRAPLGAAPDADGTEPDLGVAADGGDVIDGRVDLQPVVAVVDDEVAGQRPDRIAADAAPVDGRVDVDVDAGVAIIRILLGLPWTQPTTWSSNSIT